MILKSEGNHTGTFTPDSNHRHICFFWYAWGALYEIRALGRQLHHLLSDQWTSLHTLLWASGASG